MVFFVIGVSQRSECFMFGVTFIFCREVSSSFNPPWCWPRAGRVCVVTSLCFFLRLLIRHHTTAIMITRPTAHPAVIPAIMYGAAPLNGLSERWGPGSDSTSGVGRGHSPPVHGVLQSGAQVTSRLEMTSKDTVTIEAKSMSDSVSKVAVFVVKIGAYSESELHEDTIRVWGLSPSSDGPVAIHLVASIVAMFPFWFSTVGEL